VSHHVYIYYDPTRGHSPFYVGKGKTLGVVYRHLNGKTHSKTISGRIQKIRKAGLEPKVGVIIVDDDEIARLIECELISLFGRANIGNGPLLNLTDGGDGESGRIVSEEVRQKISKANKGKKHGPHSDEIRKRISDGIQKFNRTHKRMVSDETRKKLSSIRSGVPRPDVSKALKGKPKPPGFSERLSASKTGVPRMKMTCPHCGKVGGAGNMNRWHFDNCKNK